MHRPIGNTCCEIKEKVSVYYLNICILYFNYLNSLLAPTGALIVMMWKQKKPIDSIDVTRCWLILIDEYWILMLIVVDWCWCWIMLSDADWIWLIMIYSNWCRMMLIGADWCWLIRLIKFSFVGAYLRSFSGHLCILCSTQYVHLARGKKEMEREALPNYPNRSLHYYVTFLPSNSTQSWTNQRIKFKIPDKMCHNLHMS